jgi:hypothetical protein
MEKDSPVQSSFEQARQALMALQFWELDLD